VTPAGWTADELTRRALLEQGVAVAVNLRRHGNLIAWAKERGLFARADRATPWGNRFELGKDGDRATVIASYRDHYPPFKPGLLGRLGELRGKALACWCTPEGCHADMPVLELERSAPRSARIS
jgi:Domain of unknown function (DUF4326)